MKSSYLNMLEKLSRNTENMYMHTLIHTHIHTSMYMTHLFAFFEGNGVQDLISNLSLET